MRNKGADPWGTLSATSSAVTDLGLCPVFLLVYVAVLAWICSLDKSTLFCFLNINLYVSDHLLELLKCAPVHIHTCISFSVLMLLGQWQKDTLATRNYSGWKDYRHFYLFWLTAQLCLANICTLFISQMRTNFGYRAFCATGP